MTVLERFVPSERLLPWSIFASLIAMAGIPIYIHAPKFYVDEYGVGLGALGVVLALLRLADVVQDPLLGWIAQNNRAQRKAMVAGSTAVMACAMIALFAMPPLLPPLLWFTCSLALLFTSFSFLMILFYAQGVQKAEQLGEGGHLRLAGWRETGSLIGICLAAMAPVLFAVVSDQPFAVFAVCFGILALAALVAMNPEWSDGDFAETDQTADEEPPIMPFAGLSDPVLRRLLLLALVNASPVAITSTLFLFYVDYRLEASGWEGPLLLIYFLSAAIGAPLWSWMARITDERSALIFAMSLSIAAFFWTTTLGSGDVLAFAVICLITGFSIGADLALLPAMFAKRLAETKTEGAASAFGLWSFASKLSLALAAAVLLPLLEAKGFSSGGGNGPNQLAFLTLLYAVAPCALKALALGLIVTFDTAEV